MSAAVLPGSPASKKCGLKPLTENTPYKSPCPLADTSSLQHGCDVLSEIPRLTSEPQQRRSEFSQRFSERSDLLQLPFRNLIRRVTMALSAFPPTIHLIPRIPRLQHLRLCPAMTLHSQLTPPSVNVPSPNPCHHPDPSPPPIPSTPNQYPPAPLHP